MTRRVLVVGGGAISRRAHLPALKALEKEGRVSVAAIVEPDAETAAEIKREAAVPTFRTIEEALDSGHFDLLDLCTPSSAHLDGILVGFKCGIPVLVEKPLVANRDQLAGLADAIATNGLARIPFVGVVQNYRYYRCVARALGRLEKGVLGRLVTLTGQTPTRFPVSWTRSTWLYEQGGVFLDFAPHALDLFVLFAEAPVRRVVAFGGDVSGGRMGFVNYGQILCEFQNGTCATLDASWVTGANLFEVGLHGTAGHIALDVRNDYFQEIHGTYTVFDDLREFRQRAAATVRRLASGEYFRGPLVFYRQLFNDVLDTLDAGHSTTPSVTTLAQSMNTSLVLCGALTSVESGQVIDAQDVSGAQVVEIIQALYKQDQARAAGRL